MVHADENITFGHDMSLLFTFLYVFLLQDLHSINLVIILSFSFDKYDLGVGALSDDREHIEVIQRVLTLEHLIF